jgi:hypothetical protein
MENAVPGDVVLQVAYSHTGPDGPQFTLTAATADSGIGLMQLRLLPEELMELMSGREVHTFSEIPLPTPPAAPRGRWLEVTLVYSANTFLTYPCQGKVQILEYGTDDYAITTSFQLRRPDGTYSPPVRIEEARWVYAGRPTLPSPPKPAARTICGHADERGYLCGLAADFPHATGENSHIPHGYTIAPPPPPSPDAWRAQG